uniref:Uncharacterized protein n=1 Tax=Nelumbo nucifera TaxID=4432 RepID=A0A822ZNA5_NELNU|nr:TPA_asm: hypothetical protein HUJ06_003079 [Nelumbo nucifera]
MQWFPSPTMAQPKRSSQNKLNAITNSKLEPNVRNLNRDSSSFFQATCL